MSLYHKIALTDQSFFWRTSQKIESSKQFWSGGCPQNGIFKIRPGEGIKNAVLCVLYNFVFFLYNRIE